MPRITIKDGVLTADEYVTATRQYVCAKGTQSILTLSLPKGVTYNGAINVNNAQCPCCGEPVVIPKGLHSVNDAGVLVTESTV